ncbi:MAG: preprotein translocase subunit SecE [Candidatus Doudnabacteria bacterium RIFCSPLOWO2_02_FULL_48_8]|uniref:Protein translocase subunit SecE n=1 Tax=Candidatus Doudnabacteria bacterium RIFCSPHIGHO2_01_FULL_46_24 TaxID=1817825 RepID=A0A1F5NTV3_9BACT|nr:MAG: preprotein translocase subunit SecE [Candidatus Doudnabacteria bacterium RIFCSPHIGHO2_01_FULL_46_24]OGE95417.1 MAG: preprotein translocase subunit SecE [Candidatus Doudnabacteria bacterium RIFCSPLOWO2_02_FULL_48_8]OGE95468.1 MAG: preprotein translocase subunit SecE [Candidatus Doudnabacteria bacterium RIFCSPHIGHO2_12_FULL_48_11]
MTNPIQFLKEAKNELFKVVWPKRPEILRITLAVIIISLVIAVFLGAVDFGLNKLINFVLDKQ